MVRTDPYTPSRTEYECVRCGARLESASATCDSPLCDGAVRNVAVSRE
ncbi:rubrerythrin-like domain-containing protein [Haloarchaeobius sp. FL176]|nr:rubrerythrin-like domain-containing protein [Haloarchaeobius sp. FL176]